MTLTFLVMTISTVTAQDLSSDISVSVSDETAVDIDPDELTYQDLTPGDTQLLTEDNIDGLQIENVGSTNITQVFASTQEPSTTPFATGDPSNYISSNFLQVWVNETEEGFEDLEDSLNGNDGYEFLNRKDFAEVRDLAYIFLESEEDQEYGRFRAGEEEYFWAVETVEEGVDDFATVDPELRVGETAHTSDQTGTNDFSDGAGDYETYNLVDVSDQVDDSEDGVFGLATNVEVPVGDTVDDHRYYDVVVQLDDTVNEGVYTVRTTYNAEWNGLDLDDEGTVVEYVYDSTNTGGIELAPGDSFPVRTAVEVPRGVAQGSIDTGTVTFTAQTT